MMIGYLINAKQIINYAEWYLHNPLRKYYSVHRLTTEDHYTDYDKNYVRHLITKAKKHPRMLRFGEDMAHSLDNSFGFCNGTRSVLAGRLSINSISIDSTNSVSEYLNYLKQQKVLTTQQVLDFIKSMNHRNYLKNCKIKRFNQLCDHNIKLAVKYSKKKVQYRRFFGNQCPSFDLINREASKAKNGSHNDDFSFSFNEAIIDIQGHQSTDPLRRVRYQKALKRFSTGNYQVNFTGKAFDDKSCHYYQTTRPLDVYGLIAYWSSIKLNPKTYIKEADVPKEPAFKKDLTYHNIMKTLFNDRYRYRYRKTFSDSYTVVDYLNYIAPKVKTLKVEE